MWAGVEQAQAGGIPGEQGWVMENASHSSQALQVVFSESERNT